MMLLMYMRCGRDWEDWKIIRLLAMIELHLMSVYRFSSERLLIMMSIIFQSGCMLTGELPNTLTHIVIIPLRNANRKILSFIQGIYMSKSCCRDSPGTYGLCRQPVLFQAHWTEMAMFALKQTVDFYRYQDTPVYLCFFDATRHLIKWITGH